MPPKASQKWSPWNYIIYILVGITTFFQKPKKPTQATWQATTKTEMSQRHYTAIKPSQNPQPLAWYVHLLACGLLALPSLNHTLKDLPIPPPQNWKQGITRHVVPLLHVVSWPYLASPTHSKIYLFPPWAARNDASHITPFACGLLAL